MRAIGVLMHVKTTGSDDALYRHRIKGSQRAYVFCGAKDAGEYAERNNLLAVHEAPSAHGREEKPHYLLVIERLTGREVQWPFAVFVGPRQPAPTSRSGARVRCDVQQFDHDNTVAELSRRRN
jgi:hypothetical protein